jgi:hypothetical protein
MGLLGPKIGTQTILAEFTNTRYIILSVTCYIASLLTGAWNGSCLFSGQAQQVRLMTRRRKYEEQNT